MKLFPNFQAVNGILVRFTIENFMSFREKQVFSMIPVKGSLTAENAPREVIAFLETIPNNLKNKVELTELALKLADTYIEEKVVGKTSREDCFHIALATINKSDILVSWNFKHIVNVFKIRGYNAVNVKFGYSQIDIRSPKDILNYEE